MADYIILTYDLKGRAWRERKRLSRENVQRGLFPVQSSTYILRGTAANEAELAGMEKFLVGLGAKTMLVKGSILSLDGGDAIFESMGELIDRKYDVFLAETREFTRKLGHEKIGYRSAVAFLEKEKAAEAALAKSDVREVAGGPRLLFEAELANLERIIIKTYSVDVEKLKKKGKIGK